jgi:hypothetical protein
VAPWASIICGFGSAWVLIGLNKLAGMRHSALVGNVVLALNLNLKMSRCSYSVM